MKPCLAAAALAGTLLAADATLAGEASVTLAVDGMTCAACPYIVRQSLAAVPGVKDVKVSFREKTAVVTFDDARTDIEALTNSTFEMGFPSEALEESTRR